MTIRAKLLLVIPLLVLLANTMSLFLFQSSTVVQRGYDHMMERVLAYKLSVQRAEQSMQALYAYLLDPGARTQAEAGLQRGALRESRAAVAGQSPNEALSSDMDSYVHLLDTLDRQEAEAGSAAQSPARALSLYKAAETTEGFVREEGQRLVDLELGSDQPILLRIRQANLRLNRLGAAVIAVQTLLGVGLALWVSRSVTEPVGRLVRMARQVSEGRPYLALEPLPPVTKDELGVMTGTFLQMVASLREAAERDKDRIEQERLVKELELQALQSQIQPHFLFNSLNVLSKLALLEGAERTSDLIVSMSSLVRYRLRKLDEPVLLREELGHVMEYVTIQEARFRSRVRFGTSTDESALAARIPALTIQPLVENAFVHGIERMESGAEIRLSIRREGRSAVVEIMDNGAGMEEATRQALLRMYDERDEPQSSERQRLQVPSPPAGRQAESTGIGMRNVFRRLRLFCGGGDAVAIGSKPGQGTTVTIRIPITVEEEIAHVPPIDRG
ncbi:sensor histidine kinase [Paenibacillus sacheonensis]|uniref:histidine kinase n=1 Tax=Paenibacillus sacheonensis TaxID=742054 RepID=A0A7X4YRQ7_9BACL|nr:histidine kinase [Paenibacillus sacheonensis]MBM7567561.1 signal transduction histidine kinase [Paenibacillus sacheonensis]NBC71336.1 HAMP domain-containing protein [Paenibacillus sacheonensis]